MARDAFGGGGDLIVSILDDLDHGGLTPEVGNVHVNKWENGTGHLSVVLLARPRGVLQLRGSNLPIWADMLPLIPEEEYAERADRVRQAFA